MAYEADHGTNNAAREGDFLDSFEDAPEVAVSDASPELSFSGPGTDLSLETCTNGRASGSKCAMSTLLGKRTVE